MVATARNIVACLQMVVLEELSQFSVLSIDRFLLAIFSNRFLRLRSASFLIGQIPRQ